MAKGFTGDQTQPVPAEEGRPIWEAAEQARQGGAHRFGASTLAAVTSGSALGMGGRKTTGIDRWDLGPLIESIEALGWRLDHLEHVWAQTEHNAALGKAAHIRGVTIAHMLFRRSATA